ncbi:MAG: sulfatase [Verrucomicrobiae bacterium]|nr:sulfatase [Verrucomicrobiae bacterium]
MRLSTLPITRALLALTCLFASFSGAAEKPTNVLFLICDDLNCDLGSYGHPQVKSPNIDALAARGVRFEHAYCQYPLCGPSRASFMSGLYPDQTLIHRNAIYLREHVPNVKTVAQMFRDNGYFATRIGKIFHYNVPKHIGTSGHDDPYSWNYTINPRGRDVDDEADIFSLQPGNFGGTLSWLAADGTDEEQTDGIAAAEAAEQLEKYAKSDTPFFLAVGLFRPHTPYVAPKKYFDLYPIDSIEVPTQPEGYLETIPESARKSIRRKKDQIDLPEDLAKQAIQAYHASITFADAQVGLILEALEKSGLKDNTVVIFTSDHGYHMGEHGHWQKTTLFENAANVPLIIAGPGVSETGKTAATPAEMVDFYPTLAELCGLKAPEHLSGVSLVPALKDAAAMPRDSAFTQYENGYSLRTPRWRYTEWGEKGADGNELYDHERDPSEMINLAGKAEHAEIITKLSAKLHGRIEEANWKPKGVEQIVFENRRRER